VEAGGNCPHLFFGITWAWCSIVTFDMRYSKLLPSPTHALWCGNTYASATANLAIQLYSAIAVLATCPGRRVTEKSPLFHTIRTLLEQNFRNRVEPMTINGTGRLQKPAHSSRSSFTSCAAFLSQHSWLALKGMHMPHFLAVIDVSLLKVGICHTFNKK
jgi:hypothetical protein